MRATITGIEDVEKLNKKLCDKQKITQTVESLVYETADLIRRYAPERYGKLVNSINVIKKGNAYEIIVDVPYAIHMEYGTRYFPVGTIDSPRARTSTSGKPCFHPFIRPAVWQMMNKFPDIIKKALFSNL